MYLSCYIAYICIPCRCTELNHFCTAGVDEPKHSLKGACMDLKSTTCACQEDTYNVLGK
jgi:hypothetical protein